MSNQESVNSDLLLDALLTHELALGKLYQRFAACFAPMKDFWNDLALQEAKHAQCLKSLRDLAASNADIRIAQRFSLEAIDYSMDYLQSLMARCDAGSLTAINALSLAMKLEEATIEKNFFEVLAGDSDEVRSVLELLASETQAHYEHLKKTFLEYTSGGI